VLRRWIIWWWLVAQVVAVLGPQVAAVQVVFLLAQH
jgi:hypothetical protein